MNEQPCVNCGLAGPHVCLPKHRDRIVKVPPPPACDCGNLLTDFDVEQQHGTCVGCRCC